MNRGLVMQIEGAKEDGYLTGLSYQDISRGIRPVTDKLLYWLPEKWVSSGPWYKEENNAHFPPFWYFCSFLYYEAKNQNDCSINQQGSSTLNKPDKSTMRNFDINKPISVQKQMFPHQLMTLIITVHYTSSQEMQNI